MDEFPDNSHKRRTASEPDEPKKIERVVDGTVVRRKKPLGRRFAETFGGGDAKGVLGFITMDILMPAAKDMVADAVTQGFERMLFGDVRQSTRRSSSRSAGSAGYVSYNRYSSGPATRREEPRQAPHHRTRTSSSRDMDEVVFETRVEATEVLDHMYSLLERYGSVSVADLYELVGESGNFTDNKWGWTHLTGSGVNHVRGGYVLDLPKPEPID